MLGAENAALGDPLHRVYARFEDLPAALRETATDAMLEEAVRVYDDEGPGACAAVLRRAWSIGHQESWELLLRIDVDDASEKLRTHVLVLREEWASAILTHTHLVIGERVLSLLGNPTMPIDKLRRMGAWMEWRSRVTQWLITHRPTHRYGEYPLTVTTFDGVPQPLTLDEVEEFLLTMWPLPDLPPLRPQVVEVLRRVRGWLGRLQSSDLAMAWMLRDPLIVRPVMTKAASQHWDWKQERPNLMVAHLDKGPKPVVNHRKSRST